MSRSWTARSLSGANLGGMTRRLWGWIWASPYSLLGLLFLPLAWISGGRVGARDGVVEGAGGLLARLLRLWPPRTAGSAALTLGHVVLAMGQRDLEEYRSHEHVHVRQYERWGPFFLPAYGASSLWAFLRGRDPYLWNHFEREARERAGSAG